MCWLNGLLRWLERNPDRVIQSLLVLCTFGLIVVGALQWRTLSKTDQTLKAAQRPWIEVDPKISGPLQYMDDELYMRVQFSLKNTGHSPALNVRTGAEMHLLYSDDNDLLNIQEKICDQRSSSWFKDFGSTIFPDTPPFPEVMLLEVSKSEVESYKAKKQSGFQRPMIIGCVVYLYAADQSFHETGFNYLLRNIPALVPFSFPDEKGIPASSFELIPWSAGNGRVN